MLRPLLTLTTALAVGAAATIAALPSAAGAATGAWGSRAPHAAIVRQPAAAQVRALTTATGAQSDATAATPCAVSVAPYVAAVPEGGDDTAGFTAAMNTAVATRPTCYPAGPSGEPQAVVYVPAGTYRLLGLMFPSNVRMEVNAGATLEPTQNRGSAKGTDSPPMILWDTLGRGRPAVRNVSLVGVGSATSAAKQAAVATGGAALAGFDTTRDFTMNLDPVQTNSSNYSTGVILTNVQYFHIENVFSIQNDTNGPATGDTFAWPTSAKAVIVARSRRDSPLVGPFIQPMHGSIANQVNVHGPRGFGPNQIGAAYDLDLENIYTQGGTALRLETDDSTTKLGVPVKGARVDGITARHIVGFDCNRAVSLSPHAQRNGTVNVQDVWAFSCNQAVVAAFDTNVLPQYYGAFQNAQVDGVHAYAGPNAQLDSTVTLWTVGQSLSAIQIATGIPWTPHITVVDSSGTFQQDVRDAAKKAAKNKKKK